MSVKVKRAILDVTWEKLPDLALPEGVRVVYGIVSLERDGLSLMLEGDGLPDECAGMCAKTVRALATKIQAAGVNTIRLTDDKGEPKPVHRVATEPFYTIRFERWE